MTQAATNSITTPDSVLDETHSVQSQPPKQPRSNSTVAGLAGCLIIGLLLGFGGGILIGKSGTSTTNGTFANAAQMGGPGAMNDQGSMGVMGTVTAISSDSITVKDQMQGTSRTFSINDDTTISDNGSTTTIDTIKTGDRVMVQSSSNTTSSTTAANIERNPSMQGGPGGSSRSSSTSNR